MVAAIRELVRFESKLGLNGDLVLPALANAYLVEDDAAAERLASAYPDCHFLTATGAHYHHRMVSGGKGSSAGPLALRRDFRELERRTAELETQIRSSEAALAEAEALAKRLDEQLKTLTGSKMEAEKKAVVADEKLRQTRETCDRTRQQLDTLLAEAALLKSERARAEERQATLRAGTGNRHGRPGGTRSGHQSGHPTGARIPRGLGPAGAGYRRRPIRCPGPGRKIPRGRGGSSAGCGHRRRTFITALPGWPNKRKSGSKSASGWHRKVKPTSFACNNFNSSWRRRAINLHGLEEESRAIRAERDTLGPRVDAARAELEARRQKRSEAEVALARAESDYAHHAQQCRDELNTDSAALLAELAPRISSGRRSLAGCGRRTAPTQGAH